MCEQLEARDCPATISLHAAVIGPHEVQLTGQITNGPAAGIQVQFSGTVAGSAVTNNDGTFSYVTTDAALGTVHALGVNNGIVFTNVAGDNITSNAPEIVNFTARNEYASIWTFAGTLIDEHPAGLVIEINGAGNGTQITVSDDGTFSLTCLINYTIPTAWARTADWWGLESNHPMHYML